MSYHIVFTTAPESYDFGSTLPYDREEVNYLGTSYRVVFVNNANLRAQLDHYKEGVFLAVRLDDVAQMDYRWVMRHGEWQPLRG